MKDCKHLIAVGNIIRGFKCEKCNAKITRKNFIKEYEQNHIPDKPSIQ